ncbi:endothelial zinc finger protein induced by tumor necrosis factor alpha-like isoform X2 [Plectropomus leopardus]|uniref:endothelial zinc finger protein induced by tumor necrosis factor alpha-like isoform X2 n=1 Tax=Plectropomus leopardus TaxID=160734 RepID=UPI001C4D43ED|nr:endothelial zinc finger protein induced by tumor necrosis factor alpha-like isoform X2 [Plectropomus leopardus]
MCQDQDSIGAEMATLQCLNAFICERLSAAAVEIFGAVEKTLTEYQGEISRFKQEIDHLRRLVLWPEVRLHRSAHGVSPHCCDEEASPDCCHKEEWAPDVSLDHQRSLHIKEEHEQRADQQGPSCRKQCDTTLSPQFVKRVGHEEPPSHLYRILTVEQTADIKAEPNDDELTTTPSNREAETPGGRNPESSGHQRETLEDPLEITHHEQDGCDEQQYTEQDWSPCQDDKEPDLPQIKEEKLTSSSPREDNDHSYKLPFCSERSVYDGPHSSNPKTVYTAEKNRRDGEREGCKQSKLTRVCQPFYSMNIDRPATQRDYVENTDGVVDGDWIKALTPTRTRQKKRHDSNLCSKEGDGTGVEEDVNDLTRERRHTCPVCAKRFKESGHLKDHVRIHTGEKPYQCKECGMNFRQSGALTLHMRIHTGERPYQCTDCGRRFNRKGDMETHRVTHTGERPHLCMVCGKSFKRKSNLNTHLKIHAEDKMDYTQPL